MYHQWITSKPLPYELPFVGEVEKIFSTYGFVSTNDGQRFFFHFGTCASKPEALKVGDKVEFVLGEDIKTRRLHAQKVRKINTQDLAPAPSPTAAAILNSLVPINVLYAPQTLLTVTTTNFLPVSFANASTMPATRLILNNNMVSNTPCTSMPTLPVISTPSMVTASIAKMTEVTNTQENATRRAPLRQIAPPQQMIKQIENLHREVEKPIHPSDWNSVLFPSFPSQPLPNDKEGINLTAFERARNAWYSVNDH